MRLVHWCCGLVVDGVSVQCGVVVGTYVSADIIHRCVDMGDECL